MPSSSRSAPTTSRRPRWASRATTSSRSSCRSTWSARSSTARPSRRSTGPAWVGSCGSPRGWGASAAPTSSSASAASTAATRSRSSSSTWRAWTTCRARRFASLSRGWPRRRPLFAIEPERELPGGVLAEAADHGHRLGRHLGGGGQRRAVHGRADDRGGQGGEGEVGGGELVAEDVWAPVGDPPGDGVERVEGERLVARDALVAEAELPDGPRLHDRPERAHRQRLPGGDADVVEAHEQVPVGEHVGVDQPAVREAEVVVQPAGDRQDLGVALAQRGVGEGDDVLGLDERVAVGDEDRRRAATAGALGVDAARALDVAVLDVLDARALEGPARLLAVVADRDRDESW